MCLSRDDSLSKTTPKLRADGDACTTDPPNEIELTRGLGLGLSLGLYLELIQPSLPSAVMKMASCGKTNYKWNKDDDAQLM